MTLFQLNASLRLWEERVGWRKKLHTVAQRDLDKARVRDEHPRQKLVDRRDLRSRQLTEAREMVATREREIRERLSITTTGGAKGIVDQAFAIAAHAGGQKIYVGSAYRPSSTTTGGNVSDHSENNTRRAARDIGYEGRDLLVGPPASELDDAVVAIGRAFGRDYGDGHHTIIDTFRWRGYRIQIIWRTPLYGGHMGHIHFGAKAGWVR